MPVVQRCQSAYVVAKHRLDVKYLKYCCLDFFLTDLCERLTWLLSAS